MLRDEIKLLRPLNCAMAGTAVIISAIIALPHEIVKYKMDIILASISAFLIAGLGNALNDYADRYIDKIAHPERPIPAGKVKPNFAIKISLILIAISLFIASFINPFCFLIALAAILLESSYAAFLNRLAIGKNVVISSLVALLFIYGGFAVNKFFSIEIWILSMLAFIMNMAREIVKDIEDIKGDRKAGRKTLPIRHGIKKARMLAFFFTILAIILSPLPYFLNIFDISYIFIVAIADAFYLYALIKISYPTFAKNFIKAGMLISLIAFIGGAFL